MAFVGIRTRPRLDAVGLSLALALVMSLSSPGLASAATSGVDITATEGSSFTKRVVNLRDCTFESATIDWGDGTPTSAGEFETGNPPGIKGTHTYADEGTYQGSVTYTTDCTTNGTVNFTATVGDAPISAQGRDISPPAGRQFTAVVSHVTDANPGASASDFTAQIKWGDGSQSAGQVTAATYSGGFDVKGTHTYQHTGQAAVNVAVTDVGGSTASSSSTANILAPEPLVAKFTYSPSRPCQQEPIIVDPSGSQGGTQFSFAFTNVVADPPGDFSYTYPLPFGPQKVWVPSISSPADWWSLPVGSEVRIRRPPVTVTLTVNDDYESVSTDPQTITFANPDDVYVVRVGYYFIGGSGPWHPGYAVYYSYLERKSRGPCVLAFRLPLASAFASFTSAPTTLARESSLTTTVKCRRGPDCVGTLYAVAPSRRRPAHQASSAKRKRRRLPYIAKKTVVVPGGSKRKVTLHLTKRGRRLAHAGQLKHVYLLLLMRGDKPHKRKVKVRRVP